MKERKCIYESLVNALWSIVWAFVLLAVVGFFKKGNSIYRDQLEEQNPMQGKKVRFVENASEPENADGVRGHLDAMTAKQSEIYEFMGVNVQT